ncbi:MAG: DUF2793 domain-containing protein [Pontixanthobacter sp.]
MPQTHSPSDATPRFALPFLYAGQAQKEFTVNQAHALTDMLLHPAIEGVAHTPPQDAMDGAIWLVGTGATGDWEDYDDTLAGRQAGVWVHAQPQPGMRVYDKAAAQTLVYADGWYRPLAPSAPTGGEVIDSQMRDAFAELIETLANAGILSGN